MNEQVLTLQWRPAQAWINDWEACSTLPTGLPSLDQGLHRGGLPCGYLSLLYGDPGAGKTQLAMHCVVQAAQRYIEPVAVVDTHKTWKIRRLYQMAEAMGVADPESVFSKVIVNSVSDFRDQLLSIRGLLEDTTELPVSFVCVDTVLNGKVENKVRFRQHIEDLALLARQQRIPILLVNQVYDRPVTQTEQRILPRQGPMLSPWTPVWIELQNTQPIRQGRVLVYQQSRARFKLEIDAQLSVIPWNEP
ncbi:MAG: ATPase domain-containing protein [Candidatus Hodarchaeota archaeon]